MKEGGRKRRKNGVPWIHTHVRTDGRAVARLSNTIFTGSGVHVGVCTRCSAKRPPPQRQEMF